MMSLSVCDTIPAPSALLTHLQHRLQRHGRGKGGGSALCCVLLLVMHLLLLLLLRVLLLML